MDVRRFLCRVALAALSVSFLDLNRALAGTALPGELKAKAKQAYAAKNYKEVINLLMPHLADLPREDLIMLGRSESETKNSVDALKVFSTGMALDPKDWEIKSLYGHEQFLAGKDREGMMTLKEVVEANPKFMPAYRYLIEIYTARKNKYELRLIYQDLVEKFGEKDEFITKLCELTTLDALYDLSKKYCALGLSLNPRLPENYIFLGLTNKDTGNAVEAEKLLKKAADSFSKSEVAQMTYAQFLEEKKNFVSAYSYYLRAQSANPESAAALVGVGSTGVEIQKMQEALTAFTKACKLNKTTLPAFRKAANTLRLARNEVWKRKFESAIENCN